jgi:hypothetical protein
VSISGWFRRPSAGKESRVTEMVDALVIGGGPAGPSAVHEGDRAAAAASQLFGPENLPAP